MDITKRLNDWKEKLLDLSKRNVLINFKRDSKSVLRLAEPPMHELWETLVVNNSKLEFPNVADDNDDFAVLKKLKKSYKTILEEQDVNVLYLAFGLLEWTEEKTPDETLFSPLLLVPVSLEWKSLKSPITLRVIEDDIVVNPTLTFKLKNDSNIKLPEYKEDDDFATIIQKLTEFADENGWKFVDEVYLSILSFYKIDIYKDIERHAESMSQNCFISAFAGNVDDEFIKKTMQEAKQIENNDHDSINPSEVYQVLNADSSQQDAIRCASQGISFVLQGPPGTGKSQTITNIIATQLAEGKKVLFVSEKKAALDVVYKRLKECGLSDFVLQLHSNKTNKKDVLNQLDDVLALSGKKITIDEDAKFKLEKLVKDRAVLSNYAKQLNEVINPLNKSIFYANGIISKYADVENLSFPIPDVRNVSNERLNEYVDILKQMAMLITKMSEDCKSNPWQNANVTYLSNEFIHNTEAHKDAIVRAADGFSAFFDNVEKQLGLTLCNRNLEMSERLLSLFQKASAIPVVPLSWLKDSDFDLPTNEIDAQIKFQREYKLKVDNIRALIEKLTRNNQSYDLDSVELTDLNSVAGLLSKIESLIKEDSLFSILSKDASKRYFISNHCNQIARYARIARKICADYRSEILEYDICHIYKRYQDNYKNSFFRCLKSSYNKDSAVLKGFQINPSARKTFEDELELLEDLDSCAKIIENIKSQKIEMSQLLPLDYNGIETDTDKIEQKFIEYDLLVSCIESCNRLKAELEQYKNNEGELKQLFGGLYTGINTDWEGMRTNFELLKAFAAECETVRKFIDIDDFAQKACTDNDFKAQITNSAETAKKLLDTYKEDFVWFAEQFDNKEEILAKDIISIAEHITDCVAKIKILEIWIDYKSMRDSLVKMGLADYIEIIEKRPVKSEHIVPIFEKRFYRLWLDSVYADHPAVAQFRHIAHEDVIKEFAELDQFQLDVAKERVKGNLLASLQDLETRYNTQLSTLKREIKKQRKIMPVRKLFNKIPDLLMTLKPCLMMSPLSVSRFLESECYKFDTVIFDEASQVKTETAIGAIFRGKQIVIAGDSNQLPPTDFFKTVSTDNEYDIDEEETLDASILDEAMFLPSRELLWHYRSRHEDLIAFSNRLIYKNKLITFPSNKQRILDWGVEYIYVADGTYNSQKKPKGNVLEAERVAQEVFRHITEHPDRSLGVITFGIVQEIAVENAIYKLRKQNPNCEDFFAEDKPDAFFIKNLENVQGDERDTIIFSIGYAKDDNGKFSMNFGPVNKIGGERRLNVAITRAKYNVKLIGSIQPEDIDTERVSNEGPKLLRKYIEFAQKGVFVLSHTADTETPRFDSPFEVSVYNYLISQGYDVATQVGCSGYRIDLAIKHPNDNNLYVLGIECDGASYHSTRTARERDRLRQNVLESMGWKIYRIWSTDWIKDNVAEKQRLVEAVNEAIVP